MLRTLSRIALAATLLGSASAAMAAPRHFEADQNGYRAIYRAPDADAQRTTGFIGPSAGSTFNGQVDRTGRIEG